MKLEEQTSRLHIDDAMASSASPELELETPPTEASSKVSTEGKPKRVRTGCLTCRERHLKCDEGSPICQNCKKSNRECKRGMRLNFIDTKVEDTQLVPPTADYKINFQDESRDIAAEYRGGAGRYAAVEPEDHMDMKPDGFAQRSSSNDYAQESSSLLSAPVVSHQPLPPMSTPPDMAAPYRPENGQPRMEAGHHSHSSIASTASTIYTPSEASYASDETLVTGETRTALTTPDEVLFMQVFIEEVGIWMDSMDRWKHVSCAPGFLVPRS